MVGRLSATGPWAVVTGASRGLGRELVHCLRAQGIHVLGTARRLQALPPPCAQATDRGAFQPAVLDLQDGHQVQEFADLLRQTEVGFLFNNAGVYLDDGRKAPTPELWDLSPEVFEASFRVNVWSALTLMQACIPGMQARGAGCIVNISSGMGRCCEVATNGSAYRLSKSALTMLTRLFAARLVDTPIRCFAACPGWIKTDMGGPQAPLSPVESAADVVHCAIHFQPQMQGQLLRKRQILPCSKAWSTDADF